MEGRDGSQGCMILACMESDERCIALSMLGWQRWVLLIENGSDISMRMMVSGYENEWVADSGWPEHER